MFKTVLLYSRTFNRYGSYSKNLIGFGLLLSIEGERRRSFNVITFVGTGQGTSLDISNFDNWEDVDKRLGVYLNPQPGDPACLFRMAKVGFSPIVFARRGIDSRHRIAANYIDQEHGDAAVDLNIYVNLDWTEFISKFDAAQTSSATPEAGTEQDAGASQAPGVKGGAEGPSVSPFSKFKRGVKLAEKQEPTKPDAPPKRPPTVEYSPPLLGQGTESAILSSGPYPSFTTRDQAGAIILTPLTRIILGSPEGREARNSVENLVIAISNLVASKYSVAEGSSDARKRLYVFGQRLSQAIFLSRLGLMGLVVVSYTANDVKVSDDDIKIIEDNIDGIINSQSVRRAVEDFTIKGAFGEITEEVGTFMLNYNWAKSSPDPKIFKVLSPIEAWIIAGRAVGQKYPVVTDLMAMVGNLVTHSAIPSQTLIPFDCPTECEDIIRAGIQALKDLDVQHSRLVGGLKKPTEDADQLSKTKYQDQVKELNLKKNSQREKIFSENFGARVARQLDESYFSKPATQQAISVDLDRLTAAKRAAGIKSFTRGKARDESTVMRAARTLLFNRFLEYVLNNLNEGKTGDKIKTFDVTNVVHVEMYKECSNTFDFQSILKSATKAEVGGA